MSSLRVGYQDNGYVNVLFLTVRRDLRRAFTRPAIGKVVGSARLSVLPVFASDKAVSGQN
jgi:hypothetical protein